MSENEDAAAPGGEDLLYFDQPEQNFKIHVGDNVVFYGHRSKPFTWLQRKFILWLIGWTATNE